jgi:hypothetical protein
VLPESSGDPIEDEVPWDIRILERIDAGVDVSLIEENLARSPTERLRLLQDRITFLERVRDDRS